MMSTLVKSLLRQHKLPGSSICWTTTARALTAVHTLHARAFAASPKKKAARNAAKLADGKLPARGSRQLQKFTVALVGRPNVGKSRLFNRLVQQRLSIVDPTAGTTRDWKEASAVLGDLEFVVMDTGGLEDRRRSSDSIEAKMLSHTEAAIAHADAVLFIVDGRAGVTPEDEKFARWLKARRPGGGVHLVANKTESWMATATGQDKWRELVQQCYVLGMGEPVPVSGEHGDGLNMLYDILQPYALLGESVGAADATVAAAVTAVPGSASGAAPEPAEAAAHHVDQYDMSEPAHTDEATVDSNNNSSSGSSSLPSDPSKRAAVLERLQRADGTVQLAIVGRPNVGKSTLVNQLAGTDRVLSGPTPGLTRDPVAVELRHGDRSIRLVDTAGMRRWGPWDLSTPLEGLAVGAARKALERANVVVLVVDGSGGSAAGLTHAPITFKQPQQPQQGQGQSGAKVEKLAKLSLAASGASATASAVMAGEAKPRVSRLPGLWGGAVGMTNQDLTIAQQVLEEGRALVVALNKVDAAPDKAEAVKAVEGQLEAMQLGKGTPVVPLSALDGSGIAKLLPTVLRSYDRWNTRVGTGRLNAWLQLVLRHHPPPSVSRTVSWKRVGGTGTAKVTSVPLRLKYATQVTTRPPTFTIFANRSDVPESYRRYLVNALRDEFDLGGVPIRLYIRSAANPFTREGAAALHTRERHRQGRQQQQQLQAGEPSHPGQGQGQGRYRKVVEVATSDGSDGSGGPAGPLSSTVQSRRLGEAFVRSAASQMRQEEAAAARAQPWAPSAAKMAAAVYAAGGRFRTLSRKQKRDFTMGK